MLRLFAGCWVARLLLAVLMPKPIAVARDLTRRIVSDTLMVLRMPDAVLSLGCISMRPRPRSWRRRTTLS